MIRKLNSRGGKIVKASPKCRPILFYTAFAALPNSRN